MLEELAEWVNVTPPEVMDQLILWHTHPGGMVGPSQDDLRNAPRGIPFLVVTLLEDRVIPTWYSKVDSREELHG